MNSLTIIGNVTRDPELRSTSAGIPVCTFTVAVNRRKAGAEAGQPEADFFRVTAWRQLGELCSKYLAKGKKVAVVGSVKLSNYITKDGKQGANMEVTADEVEFLTSRERKGSDGPWAGDDVSDDGKFIKVDLGDDLPF